MEGEPHSAIGKDPHVALLGLVGACLHITAELAEGMVDHRRAIERFLDLNDGATDLDSIRLPCPTVGSNSTAKSSSASPTRGYSSMRCYAHEPIGLAAGLSEEEAAALRELPALHHRTGWSLQSGMLPPG